MKENQDIWYHRYSLLRNKTCVFVLDSFQVTIYSFVCLVDVLSPTYTYMHRQTLVRLARKINSSFLCWKCWENIYWKCKRRWVSEIPENRNRSLSLTKYHGIMISVHKISSIVFLYFFIFKKKSIFNLISY